MSAKNAIKTLKRDVGKRLDLVLLEEFNSFTRSNLKQLIINGVFKVNNTNVMPNYRIKENDVINWHELNIHSREELEQSSYNIKPKHIAFEILFEDESILVVNKPNGINVHPISKNDKNSLLNGVYHYIKHESKFDKSVKPRQVHRLDNGTSGVLLVAKTSQAHYFYSKQFEDRRVEKKYVAVVHGDFEYELIKSRSSEIRVTSKLLKSEALKKVTASNSIKAKFAETIIEFDEHFNKFGKHKFSRVICTPKTGRTHQIRVHLSQLGYPILGDKTYGGQKYKRLMLHAWSLELPKMGNKREFLFFQAPIPEKFKNTN